jgi:N-glycosylase/DNA lyase
MNKIITSTFKIAAPSDFNFRRTVYSHGWYDLPPFELDKENWILTRVFDVENASPVAASIRELEGGLEIEIFGAADEKTVAKVIKDFRHCLRLDEDYSQFYRLTDKNKHFRWISETASGRLLRSPTVFEDLIKTICTTNCSWALTKKMVANLVEKLGETAANGKKSFPTPEKMAAMPVEFYREEIRAGYRAPYFPELANKILSGEVDVESWLASELPTRDLKKQIKSVKGCGDYAAENLLKLLGRYDGLALDSYLRMRFAKLHNNTEKCEDEQIYRHYEQFGEWRGLALWLDATADWL